MRDFLTGVLYEVAHKMAEERAQTVAFAASHGISADESKRLYSMNFYSTCSIPWVGAETATRVQGASYRKESVEPTADLLAFGEYIRQKEFRTQLFEEAQIGPHADFFRRATIADAMAFFDGVEAARELGIHSLVRGKPETFIEVGKLHAAGIDREYILTMLEIDFGPIHR